MTAQLSLPRTSPRTFHLTTAPVTHAPAPALGRMFAHLPAFARDSGTVRNALLAIGAPGGPLDATRSVVNRNNPDVPAGMIFFGQFVDHDLGFDETARFGLDSVYGLGPQAQPELYEGTQRTKLRPAHVGANPIGSELHTAFCRFHNHAVGVLSAPDRDPGKVLAAARKLTTWHYQWLVVNQLLPSFVGPDLVEDVLRRGTRFFAPYDRPYLPVEFSGAVARFGDSTVHPVSERRFAGWQHFFDFGGSQTASVQPSKVIDTVLPPALFETTGTTCPAQRTLLRHLTWSLPAGQRVAREMGVEPLSYRELADFGAYDPDLATSTPLWLYVLREADVVNGGRLLGPVGGRIVAEVAIGLLRADPDSYLFSRPSWQPMLGRRPGAEYEISDFLRFARVDPYSRG